MWLIAVRGIRTPASQPHTHPYLPLGVGAVSGAVRPEPLAVLHPVVMMGGESLDGRLGIGATPVEADRFGMGDLRGRVSAAMKRASNTDTTASSPRAVCRTVLTIASLLYVSTLNSIVSRRP